MSEQEPRRYYRDSRAIGEAGERYVLPFVKGMAHDGRYITTEKGRLSELLQRSVGDFCLNDATGAVVGLELKTEEFFTGNLFLETWSNKARGTPGWMQTLKADVLLYFFLIPGRLYMLALPELQVWVQSSTRLGLAWPEKQQRRYTQMNDTWGHTVPLTAIQNALKTTEYFIETDEAMNWGRKQLHLGNITPMRWY